MDQITEVGIANLKKKLFLDENENDAKNLFIDVINQNFDTKLGKIWDWHHEIEIRTKFKYFFF